MQLRCRLTLISRETLRPRSHTAWTEAGNVEGSALHPWDTTLGFEGDVCHEPGSKRLWSTGRLAAASLGSGSEARGQLWEVFLRMLFTLVFEAESLLDH